MIRYKLKKGDRNMLKKVWNNLINAFAGLISETGSKARECGSITIFLACIMLPMVIGEAAIIDMCSLLSVKQITNNAGRLTSNAVLTSYNTKLRKMYGLVAFDSSSNIEGDAQTIFKENMNTEFGGWWSRKQVTTHGTFYSNCNPTKSRSASVQVDYVTSSSLGNGDVFKGQICDAMRYNYKATQKFDASDIDSCKYYEDSINALAARFDYDKELYNYAKGYENLGNMINTVANAINDPTSPIAASNSSSYDTCYCCAEYIRDKCNEVLNDSSLSSAASVLESKKQTFNDAVNRANVNPVLRNTLNDKVTETPDVDTINGVVEQIRDDMNLYLDGTIMDLDATRIACGTLIYNCFDENGVILDEYKEEYYTESFRKYVYSLNSGKGVPGQTMDIPLEDRIKLQDVINDFEQDEFDLEGKIIREMYNNRATCNYLTMGPGNAASDIDADNGSYSAVMPNDMDFPDSKDQVTNFTEVLDKQVEQLRKAASFYHNISACQNVLTSGGVDLLISEYATEYFSSYRRTDDMNLSGWYMSDRAAGSTVRYTDMDYIAFGLSSARDDNEQSRDMIFYTQYIGYMIEYFANPDNYNTGKTYPGTTMTVNKYIEPFWRDNWITYFAQESAYDDLLTIYDWESVDGNDYTPNDFTYIHYMKLFMLISTVENESAVLERMEYVIETNVRAETGNSSFDLDTTYTAATISADVNVDGVFNHNGSYKYQTFAMY